MNWKVLSTCYAGNANARTLAFGMSGHTHTCIHIWYVDILTTLTTDYY